MSLWSPEQGPSWSTLDFGGDEKLSHHFVRRAYQPLMLWGHLERDAGRVTVHLISDLMHPIAGGSHLQTGAYHIVAGAYATDAWLTETD